jgi:hypothetical protein
MEDFGAVDSMPDKFCEERVAECDLFVCIAGPLYGSRTLAGPSYTEREYEAARRRKKPCLIFMSREDFLLPANLIEPQHLRTRQMAFRKKLSGKTIIVQFGSCDEIAAKISQAIRNWEAALPSPESPVQAKLLSSQISSVAYRIAVLDQSAAVSNRDLSRAVRAFQTQIHRDLLPAWGVDAEFTIVPKGSEPAKGSWWMVIRDESDYEGMPAYHTLNQEGLPMLCVFVKTAAENNIPWTMAASHECLEALANPGLNLMVTEELANGGSRLVRREICDPCMGVQNAYAIEDIIVSDFVFPTWFESFRRFKKAQFDYCRHIKAPFTLAPGGYMRIQNIPSTAGWQTVFAAQTGKRTRK